MNDNFVGMLREITEEGDMDSILKSSLGGYTKKSVMDYLTFVKKQQQQLKDTYTDAVEQLQNERDALQSEVNVLQARSTEAECALQTRLKEQAAGLAEEYAALEADMDEALTRISDDANKIEALKRELAEEQQRAEQYRQAVATGEILLNTANGTVAEQERKIAGQAAEIEDLKKTERALREALADDKTVDLKARIDELMNDVAQLQSEISIRDGELDNRARRLETLRQQEQSNHAAIEQLQQQLQQQCEQNEWIECENDELGKRLQTQMEQNISLSRENSHLRAANAILQRKLDGECARHYVGEA